MSDRRFSNLATDKYQTAILYIYIPLYLYLQIKYVRKTKNIKGRNCEEEDDQVERFALLYDDIHLICVQTNL